jgi:hypothetical protein
MRYIRSEIANNCAVFPDAKTLKQPETIRIRTVIKLR